MGDRCSATWCIVIFKYKLISTQDYIHTNNVEIMTRENVVSPIETYS